MNIITARKDDRKHRKDGLAAYRRAVRFKNPEKAKRELKTYAAKCPHRNSYCLTERFCPDCPYGGTPVISAKC